MASAAGPNVVEDGLVLSLDASSPKNYNVGVSTNWTDRVGGNNGTLVGGTYHSDGPFVGAGYVEFDGQGNHTELDVIHTSSLSADFDLSGNISSTVECWVYLNSYPLTTTGGSTPHYSGATIFSIKNNNTVRGSYYRYSISTSGQLRMRADYGDGFPTTGYSTSTLSLNTWYHIAWVRDSGSNKFFLNGVEITSEFSTPNDSGMIGSGNSKMSIGADYYQHSTINWIRPITGYISNFRIVKGTALYTSNFTPPTKLLTAVPNTVLLTCQGSSITDASSSAQTLSSNGGPTANLGSPASAFVFDGTDDYVSETSVLSDSFLQGNWTISFWVNFDTISTGNFNTDRILLHHGSRNNSNGLHLVQRNSSFLLGLYGDDLAGTANTVSAGIWYNVTFTLNNTTRLKQIYINGSLDNSHTGSSAYVGSGSNTRIGGDVLNFGNTLDGKMSNIVVYSRVLSASEVQQNYTALKGRYGY